MDHLRGIDMVKTGENIRRLMDETGYTTKILQDIFGFATRSAFYKWFDGRALPTIDHLVILAQLFNCTIDDILILC